MNNRRQFLKTSLLAGAAIPMTGFENPEPEEIRPKGSGKTGKITLLQTTDVHCQLHAHDELFWEDNQLTFRKTGGYAHLATALDELRKENPQNTVVVDTGDMFQGSLLSLRTSGEALVPILNALPYDVYLPGNWEVVYQKKSMQNLMGSLMAPKVCTNMFHDLGEGKKGEFIFQPYHIIQKMGIKIGFIGYTDPMVPIRQSPHYSYGITYTEPKENIAHYVDVLRNQEKCAFVILLSHLGLSQQIALGNDPVCAGVDYIFGADTHERVRKPIETQYTKIVEPGAFGSFIGKLELEVREGEIVGDRYELVEVNPKKYPAKKEIQRLIEELEKPHRPEIQKVLGYSKTPLYRNMVVENTIDTLIVDSIKSFVESDIVLSNGFRFCPPKVAGKNGMVEITEGYLYDMIPVESEIKIGEVTGQQIKNWLEKELQNVFAEDASKRFGGWMVRFNGMKVEFEAYAPFPNRVKKILIANKPLEPQKTYTLSACEREGDPADMLCRMREVKNIRGAGISMHDCVRRYLKENSPVDLSLRHDAKILDGPQTLLSQVHGVDYEFR